MVNNMKNLSLYVGEVNKWVYGFLSNLRYMWNKVKVKSLKGFFSLKGKKTKLLIKKPILIIFLSLFSSNYGGVREAKRLSIPTIGFVSSKYNGFGLTYSIKLDDSNENAI